jgi:hypothetical protein
MDIQPIIEQVRRGTYYWRQHAIQRSIELGRTNAGRPVHVQCSLPPTVRIITLYEPDAEEWINFRTRQGRINP